MKAAERRVFTCHVSEWTRQLCPTDKIIKSNYSTQNHMSYTVLVTVSPEKKWAILNSNSGPTETLVHQLRLNIPRLFYPHIC